MVVTALDGLVISTTTKSHDRPAGLPVRSQQIPTAVAEYGCIYDADGHARSVVSVVLVACDDGGLFGRHGREDLYHHGAGQPDR